MLTNQTCNAISEHTGQVSWFLNDLSIHTTDTTASVYSNFVGTLQGLADSSGIYHLQNVAAGKYAQLDLTEMTLSIMDKSQTIATYVLSCI
jgi:hypothetical protein